MTIEQTYSTQAGGEPERIERVARLRQAIIECGFDVNHPKVATLLAEATKGELDLKAPKPETAEKPTALTKETGSRERFSQWWSGVDAWLEKNVPDKEKVREITNLLEKITDDQNKKPSLMDAVSCGDALALGLEQCREADGDIYGPVSKEWVKAISPFAMHTGLQILDTHAHITSHFASSATIFVPSTHSGLLRPGAVFGHAGQKDFRVVLAIRIGTGEK